MQKKDSVVSLSSADAASPDKSEQPLFLPESQSLPPEINRQDQNSIDGSYAGSEAGTEPLPEEPEEDYTETLPDELFGEDCIEEGG